MRLQTNELFEYDASYRQELLCGVDEAGRGPLAGPVVCAAVIMPQDKFIDGINDSKLLSEKKRERLYELIVQASVCYSVAIISVDEIDELNIYNATKKGMATAINSLKIKPTLVLTDAMNGLDTPVAHIGIIKGDQKSYSIAAASILAKVTRDKIMAKLDAQYPQYGFGRHKGYATARHYEALHKFGVCETHRKSFTKDISAQSTNKR